MWAGVTVRCWQRYYGAAQGRGAFCSTSPMWSRAPSNCYRKLVLLDRCTRVGGDFFDAVPAGGNAYVLAQILHDWDDDRSTAILTQCRKVVPVDGRLLVVEIVVPPGDEPSFGKWIDLQMLVMAGGRERTAPEYEGLFLATGFTFGRVFPTPMGPSVIEAIPA